MRFLFYITSRIVFIYVCTFVGNPLHRTYALHSVGSNFPACFFSFKHGDLLQNGKCIQYYALKNNYFLIETNAGETVSIPFTKSHSRRRRRRPLWHNRLAHRIHLVSVHFQRDCFCLQNETNWSTSLQLQVVCWKMIGLQRIVVLVVHKYSRNSENWFTAAAVSVHIT